MSWQLASVSTDPSATVAAPPDRPGARVLVALTQILLAVVFVPLVILILAAVGVVMVVEWGASRVGLISFTERATASSPAR